MTAAPDCPVPAFAGDEVSVRFDRFGPAAYALFLRAKRLPEYRIAFDPEGESYTVTAPARFAGLLGVQPPAGLGSDLPLAAHLFEDQRELVRLALASKRFAVWAQCGLGKTPIGLEFARQVVHRTGGRFLVVTVNEVVGEWLDQAARFYGDTLPVRRLPTRQQMLDWCRAGPPGVAVTNYEKFNPDKKSGRAAFDDVRHLSGIAVDENRLKTGGGKQKWSLIKSCKGIEYKLSLTATPAPNDLMEFASQASFLERMRTESDVIWTYFTRDPKTQDWTIKPYARAAFFRWMSSWSIYLNDPKRYGWRLGFPDVPRPAVEVIPVEPTPEQMDLARTLAAEPVTGQMGLFGVGAGGITTRSKLSQVAKGFLYDADKATGRRVTARVPSRKPAVVAEVVRREAAAGAQVLVWTVFDEETSILVDALSTLPGVEALTGRTRPADRPAILDRFRRGETRVLISRGRVLGYGMNFQFCSAMVFSGWTDSFEDLYQMIHRAVRFGQTEAVRVYFPVIRELEGGTLDNLWRKWGQFGRSIAEMEDAYLAAREGAV